MTPGARLQRWPETLTWVLLGVLLFLGLNGAVVQHGLLPDYDGLSYVNNAMKLNAALSGAGGEYFLVHDATGKVAWAGLPFTNTIDVLLVALLWNLLDYHLAIWLVHGVYVVAFLFLARRVLRPATVLLLFGWVTAQAYFLHQDLNFISEMEVGLFLVLFIAYLFHEDVLRHRGALFAITLLLLLMRTINLALVLPLVAAFVVARFVQRERRGQILPALLPIGLAILALSPLLAMETPWLLGYVEYGSRKTAQNWRDMTGVYDKLDLLRSYGRGALLYNRLLVYAAIAALATALVLQLSPARGRLRRAREYALGGLVVFAVLMQALTNNLMVVFWVYALAGLFVAALAEAYLRPWQVGLAGALLAAMSLTVNYHSYVQLHRQAAQRAPLQHAVEELAATTREFAHPVICYNYAGVAPLDITGLEVATGRDLGYMGLDPWSYETPLGAYVEALDRCNLAFVANRNFMWPDYVGVNRQTEAIARYMASNARRIGYSPLRHIELDGDSTRTIDVYDRPAVKVALKYETYSDYWLDSRTPVRIAWPGSDHPLDRYRLELQLMVPDAPSPAFALPLHASLVSPAGQAVATVALDRRGEQTLSFALDGLAPGTYTLVFDKTFRPPGDPRDLSALYRGARLTFSAGTGS